MISQQQQEQNSSLHSSRQTKDPVPEGLHLCRMVEPIARAAGENQQAQPEVASIQFSKGESVKVTDGPFTNFDGVIEEVFFKENDQVQGGVELLSLKEDE